MTKEEKQGLREFVDAMRIQSRQCRDQSDALWLEQQQRNETPSKDVYRLEGEADGLWNAANAFDSVLDKIRVKSGT